MRGRQRATVRPQLTGSVATLTPEGPPSDKVLSALTAEYFALHGARSSTISDSAGRAALFLGAVSTTLIAIAFIGQISALGTVFFLFALTILPTMFFLGLVTYVRALQSAVEDAIFAWAAQRIRTVFASIEPQWQRCFALTEGDPRYGVDSGSRPHSRPLSYTCCISTGGWSRLRQPWISR